MVDIEFDDRCVQHCGVRETDRSAMQPLDVRPEVKIVSFDALRPVFADVMVLERPKT